MEHSTAELDADDNAVVSLMLEEQQEDGTFYQEIIYLAVFHPEQAAEVCSRDMVLRARFAFEGAARNLFSAMRIQPFLDVSKVLVGIRNVLRLLVEQEENRHA